MATTPHPPRTRLQKHQAAVLKADDDLAAAKADMQTRSAAFGQDVMQAGPDCPPSLETAEIKASELPNVTSRTPNVVMVGHDHETSHGHAGTDPSPCAHARVSDADASELAAATRSDLQDTTSVAEEEEENEKNPGEERTRIPMTFRKRPGFQGNIAPSCLAGKAFHDADDAKGKATRKCGKNAVSAEGMPCGGEEERWAGVRVIATGVVLALTCLGVVILAEILELAFNATSSSGSALKIKRVVLVDVPLCGGGPVNNNKQTAVGGGADGGDGTDSSSMSLSFTVLLDVHNTLSRNDVELSLSKLCFANENDGGDVLCLEAYSTSSSRAGETLGETLVFRRGEKRTYTVHVRLGAYNIHFLRTAVSTLLWCGTATPPATALLPLLRGRQSSRRRSS
ncbi:hypothetical protein NFJ02_02g69720 [Pycnococcus provasolii]